MKLPIKRKPIPNTTDHRITDASGEDIARVAGKAVAYSDEVARAVVRAVNGQERMTKELERLEQELAQFKATAKGLKTLDLTGLSRHSNILFTHIRFEEYDLQEALTTTGEDGVKRGANWLEFGECNITNEGRNCFIGGRIRDGITDFEHDSCYVVRLELVGLQYKFTNHHVTYLEAHLSPDPDGIRIHAPDFEPEKVEGSWRCKEKHCDKHLMLPDGYFSPPIYPLARVVAGKRVSIMLGPRWDVIEKDEDTE